jgi:hypothetical protein
MLHDQFALLHRFYKIKSPERGSFCGPADFPIWQFDLPPQIRTSIFIGGAFWTPDHIHLRAGRIGGEPVIVNACRRAKVQAVLNDRLYADL